jgi:hypothetical protein
VGELCIGGDCPAQGYRNRPALTAERFIPDVFGGAEGARLYRTGDIVRVIKNNELLFLGRSDDQVKLRGFRIELQEIAGALRELPGVDDAVVLISERGRATAHLVACVAGEAVEAAVDTTALDESMRNRLPGYMCPARYLRMRRLPLTANGKVDRNKLQQMCDVRAASRAVTTAQSAQERELAELWAETLGIPANHIGIHDNYFELGGNSILLARLGVLIGKHFGIAVGYLDLFAHPTIHLFAAFLAERSERERIYQPDPSRAARKKSALARFARKR